MYRQVTKDKIISYLKHHSVAETCTRFGVSYDTIKYWTDENFKQTAQQREKSKYQPVGETKRKYTRGNAEAQRIDAQIKRAIKKVPKIQYSDIEIQMELENILKKKGSLEAIVFNNKAILTYQQHFYDKERELFADPKIARKLIKNRTKYLEIEPKDITPQEILRGFKISGEYYGYSHFASEWFKWFIEKTQTKTILDPCGGWGHRLLGTIGVEIERYIYNDFDTRTFQGCVDFYNDWKEYFHHEVCFYNERAETLDVSNLKYDSIFTCPPYFNKETYNNKTFKDVEDFQNWWKKVVDNVVNESVEHVGIVIDKENIDIISEPITKKHFKLVEENPIKPKKSHFTTDNTKDYMLLFKKL
jgi:hypothetical protein